MEFVASQNLWIGSKTRQKEKLDTVAGKNLFTDPLLVFCFTQKNLFPSIYKHLFF